MLSVVSLPGIKALWEGEIIRGRIFFNRLAKTLEINFIQNIAQTNRSKFYNTRRVF